MNSYKGGKSTAIMKTKSLCKKANEIVYASRDRKDTKSQSN